MDSIRKIFSSEYPPLIREMPSLPSELFVRGKLPPFDHKFLTIVGSRKHSEYGKEACEMLVKSLKGLPVVIVSGLALGIDSIAHRAALESGLLTVAVPGSGLDDEFLYPASHFGLAKEILKSGGALISPFENQSPAMPWMFPVRNRIMAGMSHATLVIEAEIKSGTLITSKHATEFNRDVFAVPGSIFDKRSEGPHMLMRIGATPITCGNDLREALGFEAENTTVIQNHSDLSIGEKKILEMLETSLPKDAVFSKALNDGMGAAEVNVAISLLEIKGLIEERSGEMRKV